MHLSKITIFVAIFLSLTLCLAPGKTSFENKQKICFMKKQIYIFHVHFYIKLVKDSPQKQDYLLQQFINNILQMDNSFEQKIELTITTWTFEPGQLFEYNSLDYYQRQQFRSVAFQLPMPGPTPLYYFYHLINKKMKEDRYEYFLERRKVPKSDLTHKDKDAASKYKLIGGIKLFRKVDKNKTYVCIQPIRASAIDRVKIHNKLEDIQYYLPFQVVRTFKKGIPLKLKQIVKFGKIQFEIVETNTSKIRQVEYGFENDEILYLDDLKSGISQTEKLEDCSQSERNKQCKICYISDQDEQNMLLSPCLCKGSGKYIHLECLKEWIQQKLKKMKDEGDGAFYQTNLLFCQICKKKFPKAVIKNNKKYGLLKFLEQAYPYIALKSKQNVGQMNDMFYISFEEATTVKVGRLIENGVILEEQSVSRNHASIELKSEEMILKDDKSKYGTLIYEENAEIIIKAQLKAIQIGNAVFSYKIVQK